MGSSEKRERTPGRDDAFIADDDYTEGHGVRPEVGGTVPGHATRAKVTDDDEGTEGHGARA